MNKLDELLKIKELLDSGIITESDFKKKKDELLKANNEVPNFQKKEEIIIGGHEKECPSCKCIIDKESEICQFCDYDFINKQIREKTYISPVESNSNSKKYISISLVAIVFIFLITIAITGTRSNNNSEVPPPPEVAPTPSTSIPNETISNEIASDTMAAVQKPESQQEVDEGGDYNDNTSENINSNGSNNTSKSDIEESVNNSNTDNGNDTINHIVIKGETMSSIAKKYNINSNELYKLYNAQPNTYEFYKANSNPKKPLKPKTLILIPSNLIRSK